MSLVRGHLGLLRLVPLLAAVALLLSACQSVSQEAIQAQGEACPSGSDCYDPVRPIGPGGQLTVEAFEWGFDLTAGIARDGTVSIRLQNTGGTVHNLTIDAAAGETKSTPDVPAGETGSAELQLFGGTTYTYYCSIPGHRAQGMEGDLRVLLPDEEPTATPTPDPNTDGGGSA